MENNIDDIVSKLKKGNGGEKAASLALIYGYIGGDHHKQWLIDQMLKEILGNSYETIIEAYNAVEDCVEWDNGIAP